MKQNKYFFPYTSQHIFASIENINALAAFLTLHGFVVLPLTEGAGMTEIPTVYDMVYRHKYGALDANHQEKVSFLFFKEIKDRDTYINKFLEMYYEEEIYHIS